MEDRTTECKSESKPLKEEFDPSEPVRSLERLLSDAESWQTVVEETRENSFRNIHDIHLAAKSRLSEHLNRVKTVEAELLEEKETLSAKETRRLDLESTKKSLLERINRSRDELNRKRIELEIEQKKLDRDTKAYDDRQASLDLRIHQGMEIEHKYKLALGLSIRRSTSIASATEFIFTLLDSSDPKREFKMAVRSNKRPKLPISVLASDPPLSDSVISQLICDYSASDINFSDLICGIRRLFKQTLE